MLNLPSTAALAALLLLAAPTVQALGFGRATTGTTLGQPLNFNATILLDASESIARECVFAEVYSGDVRVSPAYVRVSLEGGDGNSRNVRVTTATQIDEPVVTVEVTIGCGSSTSRRFVTFVDPPSLNLAEAALPPSPPQRTTSEVAPILDIVRAANAERRRPGRVVAEGGSSSSPPEVRSRADRRAQRTERLAGDVATRPAGVPDERTPAPSRPSTRQGSVSGGFANAPPRGAPRLRLDAPLPPLAAGSSPLALPPQATAAAAAGSAAAATPFASASAVPSVPAPTSVAAAGSSPIAVQSTAEAALEALQRERERIQQLEATMAQFGSDAQAMQQSMVTLQARLREAESERTSNKVVYALVAAVVFLALLALALWALRPRQRQRARWFDANANQQARSQRNAPAAAIEPAPPPPTTTRDSERGEQPGEGSWAKSGPPSVLPVTAPATIGGLEVTTVHSEVTRPLPASTMPAPLTVTPPPAAAAKRNSPLSMEELIDLEQQAEFFVVLGQDEAAIELLAAHIREGGGVSPLPYLKLLEIHQRRRDTEAYESVRESFRERFNAFAPDWNSDIHFGRALEDYPQAVARLQALWPTPMHAMQTLDSLLFRRNEADEAFDFPAYRDLLFLYSVARELAGNVETDFGSIDLFLPLEETTATLESDSRSLDLDVRSDDKLVIKRSPGRHGPG